MTHTPLTLATKLTCSERDELIIDRSTGLVSADWLVYSSLTDPWGEFGEPRIETTWQKDAVMVRDIRYPNYGSYVPPDARPCEHYRMIGKEENAQ